LDPSKATSNGRRFRQTEVAAKNDANRDVLAALSALPYDTLTGATREQISWSRRNRGVLGIFFLFLYCVSQLHRPAISPALLKEA